METEWENPGDEELDEGQGQGQEPPGNEPSNAGPQFIEVAGRRYLPEQLAPVASWYQFAASDPVRWRQLVDWSEGRAQITPAGGGQAPQASAGYSQSEGVDFNDPDVLRQELAAMRGQMERTSFAVAQHAAEVGKQMAQQRYGLNDQEVESLMQYAIDNQLVNLAGAREANAYKAVDSALSMAYKLSTPADKIASRSENKVRKDLENKDNWRKVGTGTAGSATKGASGRPKDEREAFDMMAREIEAALK